MHDSLRPLVILAACVALSGCGGPSPTAVAPVATRDPGAVTPSPTVDPTAFADAAVFGPWRRRFITPSPATAGAAQAACRAQEAVGTLPLRVTDARGEGVLTLVFADDATAAVCHATVSGESNVTAEARAVPGLADAPAPEPGKLGAHDLEVVETGSGARHVVVGRVADVPELGISFDDATWGTATMGDGWYAAWWPQAALAISVASVDRRSVVIDSFAVEP